RVLPPLPGPLAAGADRAGPPPARAAVGADLDVADTAVARPGPAPQQVRPTGRQGGVPGQLERALDDLPGDQRAAGRVVRAEQPVELRVPRGEQRSGGHLDPA